MFTVIQSPGQHDGGDHWADDRRLRGPLPSSEEGPHSALPRVSVQFSRALTLQREQVQLE